MKNDFQFIFGCKTWIKFNLNCAEQTLDTSFPAIAALRLPTDPTGLRARLPFAEKP
ncbi:hypothetical protein HLH44_04980 [Gluconacetobacter sp. 1c LMG 22058]|uniref:Uncharacterized protein n=1 Tax=Gluconacetobacter dulcium TaxID=2729096 RepID=A0A7W4PG58_9PROT|nr:hypothetical protein [Gluconacetobacter dulcium]MBB2196822.1 hypothetical protein [Gluconacetobacter dulcium]